MMLLSLFIPQDEPVIRTIERDWHQDILVMLRDRLPKVVVALIFLFILQRVVHFFVKRMQHLADRNTSNLHRAAQLRTVASIVRATSYGILGVFAFLQILVLFNISYTGLLAPAATLGVGIGLGAQSLFKDIINGVFILIEDQYNVGEVVKIAALQGTVESLTLRATTLRDGDGTVYIVPNSQVATVANLSRDYSVATLSISVDASANPDNVMEVLNRLAEAIKSDAAFASVILSNPAVLGVNDIKGREVIYPINFRVRANQKDGVLRELRRRIILEFEKQGIPLGVSADMLVMQRKVDPTAPPAPPSIGV
ncbi:mechanosensitive ion channel family protein [Granulicella sibirica]|uniref:Potassium efflux system kefA / Small-conductance mechanosensitive channel n=1 Tax=Granulicella sibirica TaxID=2479048 RepID=A0A4Q0T3J6_9BACT|nr:mechanosensitive ion channel family protein [Granulicella sibirica]RXH56588.1 Potassium efflux system kefA / Small-conductance mechanosensitive channel [Granulicella sibirica]